MKEKNKEGLMFNTIVKDIGVIMALCQKQTTIDVDIELIDFLGNEAEHR